MKNSFITSSLNKGVRIIKFNRPEVRNAICPEMYQEITNILNEDGNNDAVVVTILTGVGDVFSSGSDMGKEMLNDVYIRATGQNDGIFVSTIIDYPKLLIAVVNGPAFGIAASILPLFDIVYCSDRATFTTPCTRFGICSGCSSYTFPRTLGRSKASEMILLGKTMTPQEALQLGFVSDVIPHEKLDEFVESLYKFGKLPVQTVLNAKTVMVAPIKDKLHETNRREASNQTEVFLKPEIIKVLFTDFKKGSKL